MSAPSAPSVHGRQVRTIAARAEIARRRALAGLATPGPWRGGWVMRRSHRPAVLVNSLHTGKFVLADTDPEARQEDARHIAAAADPGHALAVLGVLDRALDVVALHSLACDCMACDVADAVLDLFSPAVSP
jgi:hypothetical protein